MAECTFCGKKLNPGTGILFVKKDGTPFFFCSRKCEKNRLKLKRKPISTKWTAAHSAVKEANKKGKKTVAKKEEVVKEKASKPKKKKKRKKKKR